jgi:hypothetical protein
MPSAFVFFATAFCLFRDGSRDIPWEVKRSVCLVLENEKRRVTTMRQPIAVRLEGAEAVHAFRVERQ